MDQSHQYASDLALIRFSLLVPHLTLSLHLKSQCISNLQIQTPKYCRYSYLDSKLNPSVPPSLRFLPFFFLMGRYYIFQFRKANSLFQEPSADQTKQPIKELFHQFVLQPQQQQFTHCKGIILRVMEGARNKFLKGSLSQGIWKRELGKSSGSFINCYQLDLGHKSSCYARYSLKILGYKASHVSL